MREEQKVVEELAAKARKFQLQARAMAKLVDSSKAAETWFRCSGLVVCKVCGLQYYDHPHNDTLNLFLNCKGEWMHL